MSKSFKPLFSVLTDSYPLDIVCRKNGFDISWGKFRSDVYNLIQKLNVKPVYGKYLLYCKSSYEFTVALFSVWQTGSVCVLPPNNSSEVLKKYENYVDALITDQADCETHLKKIAPLQDCHNSSVKLNHLPQNKVLLELFTSGTTGERKCVKKTIDNLNLELLDICDIFGPILDGTRTFSTVSHQHIYGLLHKILLPLCTGRLFINETYFYPEKLIDDMKDGVHNNVLISGPAHLKLFPELVQLNDMNNFCKLIFSSGSLLDAENAQKISSHCRIRPVEVLGSTETGGVAWRCQNESIDSQRWTPFPSVEIMKTADGFLQVKSPFIFMENTVNQWFTMGDIVTIYEDDNRFELKGRGDRIVKIGEKRLSLEEMEKTILSFGNVTSCRVFPITRKHGNVERTVLACVVETSQAPDKEDKITITNDFKNRLLGYFTRILVPKYWRFVETMPVDTQGKISIEELKNLFRKQ